MGRLADKGVSGIRDGETCKWGKEEVWIGTLRLVKGVFSMFGSEN